MLLPTRTPAGKDAKRVAHSDRAITIQIDLWVNAVEDSKQQDEVLESHDAIAVEIFGAAFFSIMNPGQATEIGGQRQVPNGMQADKILMELGNPKSVGIQAPDG